MAEVLPGIYQLMLPMPTPSSSLRYVNAYLINRDDGPLLVDTGWNTAEAFDSLQEQLAEIGIGIKDISQIVVTHIHRDHYGLVDKLKHMSQAKFLLHYLEKDLIESRYIDMEELLKQTDKWLHSNGLPLDELPELHTTSVNMSRFVTAAFPDVTLHGGDTITAGAFTFKVLWTPGHSPGHISLYEPDQKILISGDHVLPRITPNIGLHPQSCKNPLGDYLDSLNTLRQLDAKIILPGHEKPFTDLRGRIDEIIQHHEQRNLEILISIGAEPKTAYQTAREINWHGKTSWQNLPPLHKRLAIMETLSHLEAMRIEDKLDSFSHNSIIYYGQT
ncbi:MBL fold metallo-hydrolase [Chloroflexota bacterium]